MPIFVCVRRLVTTFETSDQMVYEGLNNRNGLIDQGFNLPSPVGEEHQLLSDGFYKNPGK